MMAVCCCSLAGTAACQHCSQNPFATDVWTNKTVTVCGKPSTILNPMTNADRIRSMTDEELAEWIAYRQGCFERQDKRCSKYGTCRDCWFDWLKEEYTQ